MEPGQKSIANDLAKLIGVKSEDINNDDTSFVLARQWKKIKSVSTVQDQPDISDDLNTALNSDSANDKTFLNVMTAYGTHFLS